MIATKKSWTNYKIPEKRKKLDFNKTYSDKEMLKIKKGQIPKQMEDHWFIYFQDDYLYFHRSWTGYCIYMIKFIGNNISEVWVNNDELQYNSSDTKYDLSMLENLLNDLLYYED